MISREACSRYQINQNTLIINEDQLVSTLWKWIFWRYVHGGCALDQHLADIYLLRCIKEVNAIIEHQVSMIHVVFSRSSDWILWIEYKAFDNIAIKKIFTIFIQERSREKFVYHWCRKFVIKIKEEILMKQAYKAIDEKGLKVRVRFFGTYHIKCAADDKIIRKCENQIRMIQMAWQSGSLNHWLNSLKRKRMHDSNTLQILYE